MKEEERERGGKRDNGNEKEENVPGGQSHINTQRGERGRCRSEGMKQAEQQKSRGEKEEAEFEKRADKTRQKADKR